MKGKILILLCLLALLGGGSTVSADSGYSSKPITKLEDIKFDGKTKYAFQILGAAKDYKALPSAFQNRFLRYGYVHGTFTIVTMGFPDKTATGYTSIETICQNMATDGQQYTFTFKDSKAQMGYDNKYWGNYKFNGSIQNRIAGLNDGDANIATVSIQAGSAAHENSFQVVVNNIPLSHMNITTTTSYHVSYKGTGTTPSNAVLDFAIYEIIEPAASTSVTYHFYDSKGEKKLKDAEFTEYAGKTINSLANLPNYVTATYYTDAAMETSVADTSAAPTAGSNYYVKTDYISGMPFDLSGNYFCLGSYGEEAFQTATIVDKPSVAKFAIKMTGNWVEKFRIQDINKYYLGNTETKNTFSSENDDTCKFDIDYYEFYGSQCFVLKSMANNKYIKLGDNGSISYVDNKNYATILNNLTNDQVLNFLNGCPAERYVGAYSQTQKDEGLSLNDILNGNKKVAFNSDRYYYLEAVNNPGFVLTAQASSKNLKDGSTNYVVDIANSNDFAGLWSLKNSILTHINTKKDMNVNGELGNGFGYLARSSVDGKSEPYQAFTIQLGYSSTTTYLSRTGDNSLEMVKEKPTTEAGYWYLREASTFTIPLNNVGGEAYATLCAPVDLKFNINNYTYAYTGELSTETIDGQKVDVLALTEVNAESVIPAGTPLVLRYPFENIESVFDVVYNANVSYSPNNTWKGTFINLVFGDDEATAKNYRTLGNGGKNVAGFYTPKATTKIPANRAYIEMPSDAKPQAMLPLRFEDGTLTWIDASILTGEQTDNAAIYDLSGRRIMQPQRGQLYIRGGKKFIAQ